MSDDIKSNIKNVSANIIPMIKAGTYLFQSDAYIDELPKHFSMLDKVYGNQDLWILEFDRKDLFINLDNDDIDLKLRGALETLAEIFKHTLWEIRSSEIEKEHLEFLRVYNSDIDIWEKLIKESSIFASDKLAESFRDNSDGAITSREKLLSDIRAGEAAKNKIYNLHKEKLSPYQNNNSAVSPVYYIPKTTSLPDNLNKIDYAVRWGIYSLMWDWKKWTNGRKFRTGSENSNTLILNNDNKTLLSKKEQKAQVLADIKKPEYQFIFMAFWSLNLKLVKTEPIIQLARKGLNAFSGMSDHTPRPLHWKLLDFEKWT